MPRTRTTTSSAPRTATSPCGRTRAPSGWCRGTRSRRRRSSMTAIAATARRSRSPRATCCAACCSSMTTGAGSRWSRPRSSSSWVQNSPARDLRLLPPIGRSGRAETGRQSYGIDAVNEFDPIFEDVYDYCETQEIDIDTLTHESGAAQMEINFNHGDPLKLADQTFLFKRTVRHAAMRHQIYATSMAKPLANEPGSSMHIHQSVVDKQTGRNLFADSNGRDSALFRAHVAGLQRYLPLVMPLLAPNVNSYRRLQPYSDAPINVHWGVDNRTVGLRVPVSSAAARRIENRLAGADANPYLAIAASLACGYLGMVDRL